ncbi:MAG: hypothetical protein RMJ07_05300 [Nitrososphaerota archaeon]|nr:hypothetical protein [Candidatus Bathyarchaeota archaeon]MDW8049079.1 hypothetical protein [Nitrososphaerota archaeon]
MRLANDIFGGTVDNRNITSSVRDLLALSMPDWVDVRRMQRSDLRLPSSQNISDIKFCCDLSWARVYST